MLLSFKISQDYLEFFLSFFLDIYLFEKKREREREREQVQVAEGDSVLSRRPGLEGNPRTLTSRPEPKAHV